MQHLVGKKSTMPPEIITTKRDTEIGRLLERVIRDHRKDISAFSKGWLMITSYVIATIIIVLHDAYFDYN